jgi:two-component system chemotaxis sensor kinase CheA
MDDLLRDFVIETSEHLDVVDNELVRFEQEPGNAEILGQVFRLVHTIKGTCGFLGLPRLEALTHAAETVIDRLRDGAPVTQRSVTLILSTVDRIKAIIRELERSQTEPAGEDTDLIGKLEAEAGVPSSTRAAVPAAVDSAPTEFTVGSLVYQVLERPLMPGEATLDELERAFREAAGPGEFEFERGMLAKAGLVSDTGDDAAGAEHAAAESALSEAGANQSHPSRQTVRVPVETLEHQMTMVSELVLTRNQLLEIARKDTAGAFKVPLQRLSHVTAELQDSVMKARMQPIGSAWAKLPRLVRDLSRELGKDIALEMRGADTEIDRQLLEAIRDPLLHIVRNAADHGIETPERRLLAGKPARGRLLVMAAQEGGHILLSVSDDGHGIDFARLRAKAKSLGLATETEIQRMNDQQVARFIFHPGLSTAEKVTSVSGRGVGMDVVRSNVEGVGGTIDIRSSTGQGTVIEIRIPLTLAIAAALIIESGGHRFALPQASVVELVRASGSSDARIEHVYAAPLLRLREKLLPLISLGEVLDMTPQAAPADWSKSFIIVCQVAGGTFGIVVDAVHHTEEIVVKPVSAKLRHLGCYSGNTILGDGGVIMILDPNGLASSVGALNEAVNDNAQAAQASAQPADRTALLVFRAGGEGVKAVPLELVTRLEEIDRSKIERAGGSDIVQYRGALMPLITLDGKPLAGDGRQAALVFSTEAGVVALAVDEIVDIVEDTLDIVMAGGRPGVIGSAVVRGRATDVIDMQHYLPSLTGREVTARAQRRRTVLLLDGSDFFRGMLGPVLKAAGYDVALAADGRAARKLAEQKSFDTIIAGVDDRQMFGVARECAGVSAQPSRLVGIATRASNLILSDAREAGFHDVVGRFDREGLLAALRDADSDMGAAA